MTSQQFIDNARVWLINHYPDYWKKTTRERGVLATAYICDVLKPREATGHNDGELVECILRNAGASKGDPWCAAGMKMSADISKNWSPKQDPAAVISWKNGGKPIPLNEIQRGDYVIRDYGPGKRHIGRALKRVLGFVYSIEGNTSPGDEGSQRDGQGMYRRVRLKSFWTDARSGD